MGIPNEMGQVLLHLPPHLSESVRGGDRVVRHIKGEAAEVMITAVRGYFKENRDVGGVYPKGARPAAVSPLVLGAQALPAVLLPR